MHNLINYDRNSLTETEQSIIDKIIENPDFFINKTISELAKSYFVSESTITRLVKHLGFENIKKLQMYIYERLNFINKNYQLQEIMSVDDIANNMRVFYSYSIHETIDNLDTKTLDALIGDLVIKKRIFLFGIGSSFLACSTLNTNLNIIGYNSYATDNIHSLIIMMQNFNKDDILIIFSKSAVTREIKKIIHLANAFNIPIALITNNSMIKRTYKIKHFVLFALHQQEKMRFPTLSAKIVQLIIADIIFSSLIKIHPHLQEKLNEANLQTRIWNEEQSL